MKCSCFGVAATDRRGRRTGALHGIDGDLLREVNHLSYNELRLATDNFNLSNKIGSGGFGTVYKGTLGGGIQVAVKTLSATSKQGAWEFLNEINAISKVRHPNLVELVGCCVEGTNWILVYEYVENGSVHRALHGFKRGSKKLDIKLDWGKRSAICLGVAKGLAFLHEELEPHIVHRDIKASNILLDKDFNPKIGDFGLAKLFPDDITHISTRIAGTTGYLAPEYAMGGHLTMKADVYSFGVLILEIISGRNTGKSTWGGTQKILLEWAWELYKEGKILEIIDPELGEYPEEEVIKHIKVAFFCTQAAANRRPPMGQVVDMLSRNIKLKDELLTAPGFFQGSAGSGGAASTSKNLSEISSSLVSSVPVTITEVAPR